MKKINQRREQRSTNCGGQNEWFDVTTYEIEADDVGHTLDHYLGFRHASYTFKREDVGRHYAMVRQPDGYRCGYFLLNKEI